MLVPTDGVVFMILLTVPVGDKILYNLVTQMDDRRYARHYGKIKSKTPNFRYDRVYGFRLNYILGFKPY